MEPEAPEPLPLPRQTLGDLLRTLYEMGFSEGQVQDALRAGCLSAPEAAEWLLQERGDRGQLPALILPQQLQRGRAPGGPPNQRAMDAFNPPRKPPEAPSGPPAPRLSLSSTGPRPDAATQEPLQGRARAEDQALLAEKQHREQLAEQLRAEKRSKRKEHELVLRRIADDRRHVQVKAQLSQAAPSAPGSLSENGAQQQEQPPGPFLRGWAVPPNGEIPPPFQK
nr:PREDICTED: uncharacterized protein LOC103282434 [Anolis carolinensis]|eukprot:XP_008123322.1 PREDICTED: uncharacterized protein LOC103282434 [Anolis carolinensis]